ncbi:unnamed protein product [Sympodiomycopsis kandeliae]
MFRPILSQSASRCATRLSRPVVNPLVSCTAQRYQSTSSASKVVSAAEAVKGIKSGDTVLSSGFGLCGTPDTLIKAISENPSIKDLTCVSNNAGSGDRGLGKLLNTRQISRMISSFIGSNKTFEQQYLKGEVALQLTPQGTMVERCRAGAVGIPAFYTPTGYGTSIQTGEIVTRYNQDGKAKEMALPRESREFNGKNYLLEEAIYGDVAIVHAWKADEIGNVQFRYTASNFGSTFAKNAKLTIIEAEEIVPVGSIDPNFVHVPAIFVNKIVQATEPKQVEVRTVRQDKSEQKESSKEAQPQDEAKKQAKARRQAIVTRAAKELQNGEYVNLGVGIPSLVPNHLPEGVSVVLHSENGILGMGPYPLESELDPDLVNAGKETVTLLPGGSTFDSCESFGMIRGGHVDVTMLGALQVSSNGDLANYAIPGKVMKGMGGAMDLVSSPDNTKVVVLTDHVDKNGQSKVVQRTQLPLTGSRCVSKIITDLAVFEVNRSVQGNDSGLTLVELQPGVTLEEVKEKTQADYKVADHLK